MKEVINYLKYKIRTEKLNFIGYILYWHVLIGVFGAFMKYGSMLMIFTGLLNYKRKKEIMDFEKILPVSSRTKKIALSIYFFLIIVFALLFGKIKNFDVIRVIILGWCFIFIIKVYNEKFDLKKKLLRRMGR